MRIHYRIISCAITIMIISMNLVPATTQLHDFPKASSFAAAQYDYPEQSDWQTIWDSKYNDDALDVAGDLNGNSYVVGSSGPDAFLLKFNIMGNLVWNVTWDNWAQDIAAAVVTDAHDFVYVAGTTIDDVENDSDVFILKFSSEGSLIWQRIHHEPGNQYARGITCYEEEYLAICGSSNSSQLLALSYSLDGVHRWNKTWAYSSNCTAYDIAHDSMSNLYIVGTILNDVRNDFDFLLVTMSSTGEVEWYKQWGTLSDDIGHALDIWHDGQIGVTGYSWRGWQISTLPYSEIHPNGTLLKDWIVDVVPYGPNSISGLDLLCHSSGRIYIVGSADSSFFLSSTNRYPGSGGFAMYSDNENIAKGIAELADGSIAFITTESRQFSSDYITVERMVKASYEEPDRHEVDIIWEYSSDGIIEPLETGFLSNEPEKSILCKLFTIESEWIEVINNGEMLWRYIPESASILNADLFQIDNDDYSEVLLTSLRENDGVGVLSALDQDGTILWTWDNNSLVNRVLVLDVNGDSGDEIAIETESGLGLLSSVAALSWFICNTDNISYNLHSHCEYDGDGDSELVVSRTERTAISNKSFCMIIDESGNCLLEFPMYWNGLDGFHQQVGSPVILEAVNLVGDLKSEYYYALAVNETEISESIVANDGEDIIWQLPWAEGRNLSSPVERGVYFCDLDQDNTAEILRGSDYGGLYAMEPEGTILWTTYLGGKILHDPSSKLRIPLVDFFGDGIKGIMGGENWVYLADPLSGNLRMSVSLPKGVLKACANIDNEAAYEIISSNVNALVVIGYKGLFHHPTDYTYDPNQYLGIMIFTLAVPCVMLVVVVLLSKRKTPQYT